MKKILKENKGFTIIELLVVIGVFSGVITFIVGIFVSNFKMQRRTMTVQKTIGEISYALEYMSRAIRMARNDVSGSCLEESDPEGYTYGTPTQGNGIQFIDYQNNCVKFFLEDGLLKKGIRETGTWNTYKLTSGLLEVQSFEATSNVLPGGSGDLYVDQPSVTLLMEVEETDHQWWKTKVQSTITRRRLDINRLQ
jgi:prepilin-type N-terminal cleavage/methylation domain-containing protein